MSDTEKWKAKAAELLDRLNKRESAEHARNMIEQALAEAAAEGEKYGWQRGHSAATAATRGRGSLP